MCVCWWSYLGCAWPSQYWPPVLGLPGHTAWSKPWCRCREQSGPAWHRSSQARPPASVTRSYYLQGSQRGLDLNTKEKTQEKKEWDYTSTITKKCHCTSASSSAAQQDLLTSLFFLEKRPIQSLKPRRVFFSEQMCGLIRSDTELNYDPLFFAAGAGVRMDFISQGKKKVGLFF